MCKNDQDKISFSPLSSLNPRNISELQQNSSQTGTIPGQFFSLQEADFESCKEKKMFFLKTSACAYRDYIPPKLYTGKEWIIYYSVIDPATNKMKRIRMKVNRIPMKERKKACKNIMADISVKLALGWNPLVEAVSPRSYETLDDAMNSFLRVKGRETEENTMRCYRSYIKIFRNWTTAAGMGPKTYACAVNKTVALAFMNDVDEDDHIAPRTYNNYLRFYRTMFNWMMGKGYVSENPFDGIPNKAKRLTTKNRRILSDEELGRLFSYLQENNVQYLRAAMLCYCCLMRPKEIAMLKCGDIDLEQQQADHSSVAMTAIYVGQHAGAKKELMEAAILKI